MYFIEKLISLMIVFIVIILVLLVGFLFLQDSTAEGEVVNMYIEPSSFLLLPECRTIGTTTICTSRYQYIPESPVLVLQGGNEIIVSHEVFMSCKVGMYYSNNACILSGRRDK